MVKGHLHFLISTTVWRIGWKNFNLVRLAMSSKEPLMHMWNFFHTHVELFFFEGASLVAQMVNRLSAMQETQVRSLGWEDPLEKEMAAHSSILAWKNPWTVEPGRLLSTGSKRFGHY